MRYLGWGTLSATARQAAFARADADPVGGSRSCKACCAENLGTTERGITKRHFPEMSELPAGLDFSDLPEFEDYIYEARHPADASEIVGGGSTRDVPKKMLPPKLGMHSGYCGYKGKRVQRPPRLFPFKPPSSEELGIADEAVDTSSWPIHLKRVGSVNWEALGRMAKATALEAQLKVAQNWVLSPDWYGIDWVPLAPTQIPYSSLTEEQCEELMEFGKLREVADRSEKKFFFWLNFPT
jgi:hypothetical protein